MDQSPPVVTACSWAAVCLAALRRAVLGAGALLSTLPCVAQSAVDSQLAATRSPHPIPAAHVQETPRGSQLSGSDWSSIRSLHEAALHQVAAVDGGHAARNPGQHWTTRFDGRGFTVTPDTGTWSFGLELGRYAFGDEMREMSALPAATAEGGRMEYRWDDILTEWFQNDQRGLEHGYTVASRPSTSRGPLTLTLAIRGDLEPVVSADGRDVRFHDESSAVVLCYAGLTVFDAGGRGLASGWAVRNRTLVLEVDDHDASYPLTIDPFVQRAYLKASNTGANDRFGWSVSVSGDTVVIGAPFEDSNATGVNGGQGNNSAVDAGAAYVFVRCGTTWSQQAYLKASNTEAGDEFGGAVAVDGDTVVVGANQEDSDGSQGNNSAPGSGAVYVFVRNGTSWSQQAYLKASNAEAGDIFGSSVSIAGDTVVVGAIFEASGATGINGNQSSNVAPASGAAYVFVRGGTSWSQQAYIKASNAFVNFGFGWSVSVHEDTLVVGSPGEASDATGVDGNQNNINKPNSGAAYVFKRSGTSWTQEAYLKASNTDVLDQFGMSVSVSSNTVVVGARGEDSNATGVDGNQNDNSVVDAGAAYVFVRNVGTWSQQAYLKASNTDGDLFGESVSVSGNTVVVGARYEASNATGVNGIQSDNSLQGAGAAYAFARSGSAWSQQAYLKASNTGDNEFFGFSVSVSGDTVIVGAFGEDGNATGVNGDQSDNSAGTSGASYLFQLGVASEWTNTSPSPTTAVARGGQGMCFDPIRGKVLMFGGKTLGAFGTDTNELWSYDGISWTLLNPTGSLPPPTLDAEFVYDSNRGVFVTYGSTIPLGPAADRTWEYDPASNAWAQKLPPVTPGGLASYGMAFDPANNKIVLYGGQTGSLPVNSDATWLYDGTTWNQVATMNSPGPLERPGMCFHDGLGRTVLFGGSIGSTVVTDNTWLFDGSDWTQVAISGPRPLARADCRMVYDSIRQICVMSGGEPIAGPHFNDTWELDLASMTWTQSPSSFTGIRVAHGLAFDANRGWVVQFGGWNSTTFSMYGDTWEYGVRSETFGTGCPGSNGIPALDACDAPRFGQPYVLSVSNLRMAAGLAVFVMSLTDMPATPLVGLGMPGCTGYVPMDVFLAGAGVGGLASISLLMPNSIYLVDTTIFSQVLSFDPMINPAWLAISNAHKGTLGH